MANFWQYFSVVVLYISSPVIKPKSVKENYKAVLFCGTVYYAVQDGSHFWVWWWNHGVSPLKRTLQSSTFLWYKVIPTFESMNEIVKCESN